MKTKKINKTIAWWATASFVVALFSLYWGCSTDQSPQPSKAHPPQWMNPASDDFHGTIVTDTGAASCKSCHGHEFTGGESKVSCYRCHQSYPHPQDWVAPSQDGFHGLFLRNKDFNLSGCQRCHGQGFQGGRAGVSCYRCHSNYPHPPSWLSKGNEAFHGNDIRQRNWSMRSCTRCHGEDYRGAGTNVSCYTCHTEEGGPEACNVCHGNPEHAYPPEDLNNNTATTALGVGAHAEHMNIYNCELCHEVPDTFDEPTHIDSPPAEVKAVYKWDREAGTCAGSCHGAALVWNNFGD